MVVRREFFVMKIDIMSRKKGYASLEVIAMSLIGFTLVLALLSIALNKRVLIQNEIKVCEKRLNRDDEKIKFLGEILSSVNKKNHNDEESLSMLENENITKEILNEEVLEKLSLLETDNNKFNLYFNEEKNIFILEENLENNINFYYYDYEIRDKEIYFKER